MIKVYHKIKSDFFAKTEVFNPAEFTLIAEVQTDDLEKAYELTNNITHPWTENAGVKFLGGFPRSTSVGDVAERNGKFHAVAHCGFKEIPAVA